MHQFLVAVLERHERRETALEVERLRRAIGKVLTDVHFFARLRELVGTGARVDDGDAQTLHEIRLLAQMRDDLLEIVFERVEDGAVGGVGNDGAVEFGRTEALDRRFLLADRVLLHKHAAVAVHFRAEIGGERVYH